MDAPRRIQRKRTRGWKMPENTVYVGRPTRWGNPFFVGHFAGATITDVECEMMGVSSGHVIGDYGEAVHLYRRWWLANYPDPRRAPLIKAIRGKNLCCWCPLDQPCHADVLLELATPPKAR